MTKKLDNRGVILFLYFRWKCSLKFVFLCENFYLENLFEKVGFIFVCFVE